jgi:hypothetical protein
VASLRTTQKAITGELHAMVKGLLGKHTREAMLQWLGLVLEGNLERAKMQANLAVAASHGFFLNLCAVMLKLCGPFMDPSSQLFWKRVDVRYVTQSKRISFREVGTEGGLLVERGGHIGGEGREEDVQLQGFCMLVHQVHQVLLYGSGCVDRCKSS